ncbi:MAG: PLDc N-terminal domain-containing protein [Patescibacteria group bacterium]
MFSKKLIAIPAFSSLAWSLTSYIAFAQATCTVNGKQVPCEQAFQTLKTWAGLGFGAIIAFIVLLVLGFIFWLMMLIHASTKPIENRGMWVVILLFTSIIGAVAYYFAVKRKFNREHAVAMPK